MVHVGTNNADKEGTTVIVDKYRNLLNKTKEARVGQIIMSGLLPVFGNRVDGYRNSKRMAIKGMMKRLCKEEDVGYVDLWDSFVGKKLMYSRDGLHLSGKAVQPLPRDCQGITESWAHNDITYAELGLEGYVMFRKDRIGKKGGGVLLYTNDTIPAYEVQLKDEADCNEAIWCILVTGHTTVTIGVVYRCPKITIQDNDKIHNAISEVSKGDCIIMGDFNHGNIQWDTLQGTGVEDSTFLCLVQDNFLTQHLLEPTRAARVLDIVLSPQNEFVDNVEIQEPLGSSDHYELHFNINIKSDKTQVKQCRRDFRKRNYTCIWKLGKV